MLVELTKKTSIITVLLLGRHRCAQKYSGIWTTDVAGGE